MKVLASIGLKHGENTGAAPVVDVRKYLPRNPFRRYELRRLRGTDPEVQEDIEQIPGFEQAFKLLQIRVADLLKEHDVVYLACTAGHHRSVYCVERLSKVFDTDKIHLHLDRK